MVGFNIDFKNIINNIDITILKAFLYIIDIEDQSLIDKLSLILSLSHSPSSPLSLGFEQKLKPNVVYE